MIEDPFTGSATGGMAAYLWRYGLIDSPTFIAEQGHWIQRPGEAIVEVVGPPDDIETVKVGGSAVTVMRGELLAQIKAMFRLIERHGQSQADGNARRLTELPLTNGPLLMGDLRHHVELNGKPLDLSPKEYELLKILLRHPGRVFGRETLLRAVWGYNFAGDSRTVDVHVQRLRQKIEADPSQPQLLLTVRSIGYKLASWQEDS